MVSMWNRSALRWAGMVLGIYLVCDGLLGGPVLRFLREGVFPQRRDVAARVCGRTITEGQVERALRERLWRLGMEAKGFMRGTSEGSEEAAGRPKGRLAEGGAARHGGELVACNPMPICE